MKKLLVVTAILLSGCAVGLPDNSASVFNPNNLVDSELAYLGEREIKNSWPYQNWKISAAIEAYKTNGTESVARSQSGGLWINPGEYVFYANCYEGNTGMPGIIMKETAKPKLAFTLEKGKNYQFWCERRATEEGQIAILRIEEAAQTKRRGDYITCVPRTSNWEYPCEMERRR